MSHSHNPYYSEGGSRAPLRMGEEPMQTLTPPPSSPPPGQLDDDDDLRVLARDVYRQEALRHHRGIVPQDDFEILVLGSDKLSGLSIQDKINWLRQERADTETAYGSREKAERIIKDFLDAIVEPTGMKPKPGSRNVKYLEIPGEDDLSLRFWPGCLADVEYCMDFFRTKAKTAINMPPDYGVWVIPDPAMPWMSPTTTELRSLERSHGFKSEELVEGQEKFILRDGMYCQLVYHDRAVLRFRVPMRPGVLLDDGVPIADPE